LIRNLSGPLFSFLMAPSMAGGLMNALTVTLLVLGAMGQQAGESTRTDQAAKGKSRQLLELHTSDAASFSIFRDVERTQNLELKREPVYRWTNPTRVGGQTGEVFVWTFRGRPEVVGSIFSHPAENSQRLICHELHSLSLAVLVVDRKATEQWAPQAPGVDLKAVDGAPTPAGTPALRLAQLRSLAREFTGKSMSEQNQTWELRLLPQPLYRYETTDPDILDGALFTLVSSAGTDPEIILVLEARKVKSDFMWVFGAARFSDMNLWLNHKNHEVWSSIRSDENTFYHDAKHRFRFYQDRFIPELRDDGSSREVKP
jgi:hypothetical protein